MLGKGCVPLHRNSEHGVSQQLFLFQEAGIVMLVFEVFVAHPLFPGSCFYWCFHVHMEAEDTLLPRLQNSDTCETSPQVEAKIHRFRNQGIIHTTPCSTDLSPRALAVCSWLAPAI